MRRPAPAALALALSATLVLGCGKTLDLPSTESGDESSPANGEDGAGDSSVSKGEELLWWMGFLTGVVYVGSQMEGADTAAPSGPELPEDVRSALIDALTQLSECIGYPLGEATVEMFHVFALSYFSDVDRVHQLACMLDTATCDEALECMGGVIDDSCDPTAPATCAGSVKTECYALRGGHNAVITFDCDSGPGARGRWVCAPEAQGARCRPADRGMAVFSYREECEHSRCPASATVCLGADCTERHIRRCEQGVSHKSGDCAVLAPTATCVLDPETDDARCSVAERECESGVATCEGDVARVCLAGEWTDFDCRKASGASCRQLDGLSVVCEPKPA